ncbi:GAF domain-containing protein [Oceanispirochaeta sp.]|jgi:hypothetical protein|uniref:sensor domain-containing diguanylate cyclase n=1 Tax=Oceanispirochaeta sp. TaxID=2035350 RepID=UPI002618658B|nr:GAF domain-containing protein [Oceanispirochaeta sp.]MDA3955442.1 GAF domain-containing protein [Oceanispirochaeta sp.]
MHLKNRNSLPETLIIATIIGCLSVFPILDFGISSGLLLILTVSLYISFWHGRLAGLITIATSVLIYTLGRLYFYHMNSSFISLFNVLSLGALLIYMGGALRTLRENRLNKIMIRYRKASNKNTRLTGISRAQQEIIKELEERVTRQKSSLNLLYERIKEIDCLETNMSISKLLETLIHFTDAETLSIWVFDPSTNKLRLRMRKGVDQNDINREILDLQDTIEGWVFRNNQLFSMRMTLDYDNLKILNTQESIICCPVVLDNKIWGVINIDSLPFIKYSEYTENLIQIIISLAQPALNKALEFENLLMGEEQHETTGLPQFTQLYRILDKNRYDESGTYNSSSLILLEFHEFAELSNEYGNEKILKLQAELLKELADLNSNSPELFHYRQDAMMALFIPHLDYDGCSLYCLKCLEFINSKKWKLGGHSISIDMSLGYSSSGTNEKVDPDELIKRAEYLLEIQKI